MNTPQDSSWGDEQTGAMPLLSPPMPPPMPPPGSSYDIGLSNTPLPPPPPYPPQPSYTSGTTQMPTAFVSNLRAEIRQLEGYFAKQTRKFRWYGTATLLCAAAVPVMVAADAWPWLVALSGAVAAISGSVQTLYRFQDSGLSAMSLANRLEAELVRYETGTMPYAGGPGGGNFNNLVDRVTTLREEASASFHGVWSSASIKS
ncbi:DUF4231 domain-containing protein [Allorhizocola rhizosphaerae]|uniref:DUF4231 domain-containing protein n=1 Tax=Allorhizocola rhizosphaerae TaxID=1872709 RepID=UPI0013C2EF39|nr:DUF4231 domain-containing protein [Allorhizocola rhizosphaerae]